MFQPTSLRRGPREVRQAKFLAPSGHPIMVTLVCQALREVGNQRGIPLRPSSWWPVGREIEVQWINTTDGYQKTGQVRRWRIQRGKRPAAKSGWGWIWEILLKSLVQGFSDNPRHRITQDVVKMKAKIQQFWVERESLHFFYFNFYLFLAVLGLCCCTQAFSSGSKQGLLSSCSVGTSHCSGFSYWRAHRL